MIYSGFLHLYFLRAAKSSLRRKPTSWLVVLSVPKLNEGLLSPHGTHRICVLLAIARPSHPSPLWDGSVSLTRLFQFSTNRNNAEKFQSLSFHIYNREISMDSNLPPPFFFFALSGVFKIFHTKFSSYLCTCKQVQR